MAIPSIHTEGFGSDPAQYQCRLFRVPSSPVPTHGVKTLCVCVCVCVCIKPGSHRGSNSMLSSMFPRLTTICHVILSSGENGNPSMWVILFKIQLFSFTLVRFPSGAGYFYLHHRVQKGSGAHPASYPMGTRYSFAGGKAAGE